MLYFLIATCLLISTATSCSKGCFGLGRHLGDDVEGRDEGRDAEVKVSRDVWPRKLGDRKVGDNWQCDGCEISTGNEWQCDGCQISSGNGWQCDGCQVTTGDEWKCYRCLACNTIERFTQESIPTVESEVFPTIVENSESEYLHRFPTLKTIKARSSCKDHDKCGPP